MDEIENAITEYKNFIRKRITELRLNANVSEYQLSAAIEKNKGYIQSITSGKSLPSMSVFLNICLYFNITPAEFFDTSIQAPQLLNDVVSTIKQFTENDLNLILEIAKRMKNKT